MNDGLTGLTVAALCRQVAQRYPSHLAVIDGVKRTTYAELDARTDKLAQALQGAGIVKGDRVAALLPDSVTLIEVGLAAAKVGAIFMPLNWRLAPPELAYILGNAEPSLWFVSKTFEQLAAGTEATLRTIAVPADTAAPSDYETFLMSSAEPVREGPAATDPWIMLYTSGTTGRPKGCLLGHAGQYTAAFASATCWRSGPDDIDFSTLPLFHVAGLGLFMLHLAAGATTLICPRGADAEQMLRLVSSENCTALTVAPSQLVGIVEAQKRLRLPLSVRITTMGGGMHPPELIEEVQEVMRTKVLAGYGQTEAGNFVSYFPGEEQLAHPTAAGRILTHLEARVVDEADQEVPLGEPGELCLRGPSVLLGYWKNPAATTETLRGGWHHSGDFARLDSRGLMHFVGRKKDLIKTGGENVYPLEVEQVLLEHPAIADCCVFGVADEKWGEAVKAAIVLREGHSLLPAEAVAWCRKHIAGYKRPRYVEFLAAIPRSNLGKVVKPDLQARALTPDQKVD